jgi:hypothetical protein
MSGTTALLGSVLRIAATTAAAGSLRRVADETKRQMLLVILVGIAGTVGALSLSAAAFIVLREQLGAAEAWLLVGVFYSLVAVAVYFLSQKRR